MTDHSGVIDIARNGVDEVIRLGKRVAELEAENAALREECEQLRGAAHRLQMLARHCVRAEGNDIKPGRALMVQAGLISVLRELLAEARYCVAESRDAATFEACPRFERIEYHARLLGKIDAEIGE